MRASPAVVLFGLFAGPVFFAAAPSRPLNRIYIGAVVSGLDEDQFRVVLKDELVKAGFAVAETSDRADAVLSGKVSGWTEWAGDFEAVLVGRDGKHLWQGSVRRPIRTHKTHCEERDSATLLAQNLARAISRAKMHPAAAQ